MKTQSKTLKGMELRLNVTHTTYILISELNPEPNHDSVIRISISKSLFNLTKR